MFDHLEPKHKKRVELHHHISLLFLMASCLSLVVIFAIPLVSFTKSVTPEIATASQVSLWLEPDFTQSQSVVVPQTDFELARYTMKVSDQSAKLLSLRFTVDGVGELNQLDPVRLYVDEVQVGTGQAVTEQGDLKFNLVSSLPAGIHTLALRSGWHSTATGQLIQVSLMSAKDIVMTQQDQLVTINSLLPLKTETIVMTDRGILGAVNAPVVGIASIDNTSDANQSDIIFKLTASGEPIDVTRLTFTAGVRDYSLTGINLLAGDTLIKSYTDRDVLKNSTEFIVPIGALKVTPGATTELRFRLVGAVIQDKAEIQVRLSAMTGMGFVSGQEIKWQNSLPLVKSHTFTHDQLLWQLVDSASSYSLVVKSKSTKSFTVNQLTLGLVGDQAVMPDNWRVTVDGQSVLAEVPLIQATKAVIRFPNGLKLNSGQTVAFQPVTSAHGGASVYLLPEQLLWDSGSQDWYVASDDQSTLIPATHITW